MNILTLFRFGNGRPRFRPRDDQPASQPSLLECPGVLAELVSAYKPLRTGVTKRGTCELIGKRQRVERQRPDVGEHLANTVIEKRR